MTTKVGAGDEGRVRRDPSLITVLLCLGLIAMTALLLSVTEPVGVTPWRSTTPGLITVLVAMFAGAELWSVSLAFRRQTYSFTLGGVPLVIALLTLSPLTVVVVRLIGAAAALAAQRRRPIKMLFNLSSYAIEAAVAGWLLHRLLDEDAQLNLTTLAAVVGAVCLGEFLSGVLVAAVIRVHGGEVSVRILLAAAAFGGISSAAGVAATLLLAQGAVGWLTLAVLGGVAAALYRSYTVLANRHEALAQVDAFVQWLPSTDDVVELAGQSLPRIRSMLHASCARMVLVDPDGVPELLLTVDENDALTVEHNPMVTLPTQDNEPRRRSRWLVTRSQYAELGVPLDSGYGAAGWLSVHERMADQSSFTTSDLTVLRTLSGHLGIALGNSRMLARLRRDARHDVLTGLANRSVAQERLEAVLSGPSSGADLAVLLLDLDGFKEVNDALGHGVGDLLLCHTAERLTTTCPPEATVCRLGGDEFAVVLTLCDLDVQTSAVDLARQLAKAVGDPAVLDGALVTVQASVGVALPAPGLTASDLLRHADTAMYAAKVAHSGVTVYTPELDRGRAERLALMADLRVALERDELFLVFQPQVEATTGQVRSAEALVRWQHPRLGELSPAAFVPLAESTGLVDTLSELVLGKALTACRGWREAGLDLTVAVNLSARNIGDTELPCVVRRCLEQAGVPASSLILEITESSIMNDPEGAVEVLHRLVAAGITLSLDDFGTGYSSLSYLQRLPVQEIKIDRSFIGGLVDPGTERASQALVRSIVGLGAEFGLRVVAEGVEHEQTLQQVWALGCHGVQGYFTGRPQSAAELAATARRLQGSTSFAAGSTVREPRRGPARPGGLRLLSAERDGTGIA